MTTERELQTKTIDALQNAGYAYAGSGWEENQLHDNFLTQLAKLNETKVPDGFTETEKKRILLLLPNRFRDAFSVLRYGLTVTLDSGEQVTLSLLDSDPKKNTFQVIEEVNIQGVTRTRLDLVLLINGIPVVNIELKRRNATYGVDGRKRTEDVMKLNRLTSSLPSKKTP